MSKNSMNTQESEAQKQAMISAAVDDLEKEFPRLGRELLTEMVRLDLALQRLSASRRAAITGAIRGVVNIATVNRERESQDNGGELPPAA